MFTLKMITEQKDGMNRYNPYVILQIFLDEKILWIYEIKRIDTITIRKPQSNLAL